MNNEKRNWKNTNDRREGKTFEKRDMKNILKNDRPYPKREHRGDFGNRRFDDNRSNRDGGYGGRRFDDNRSNRDGGYGGRRFDDNRNNRDGGYGGRRFDDNRNNRDGGYGGRRFDDNRSNRDGGYGGRRFDDNRRRDDNNQHRYGKTNDAYPRRERFEIRKKSDLSDNKSSHFVETRFDDDRPKMAFRKRRSSPDYDPHAKYSQKKQIAYKQSFIDPTKPIRLNKYLANAGVCSRREADGYIQAGVISVNGTTVSELGAKVLPTDKVMFHNQTVSLERKIYILINKPKDTVTTVEDTHHRKTVMDVVRNACSERVYPVGRLDRNTTGVLLITNDGELTTKLTHPKNNMKKIYHVGLNRPLEKEDFEQILEGVDLGDLHIKADALEFVKDDNPKEVGIEIHSGQNRIVRRIFDHLGYKVVKLDRVYFAGLTKKNVPRGKYRYLTQKEVSMLQMGAFG